MLSFVAKRIASSRTALSCAMIVPHTYMASGSNQELMYTRSRRRCLHLSRCFCALETEVTVVADPAVDGDDLSSRELPEMLPPSEDGSPEVPERVQRMVDEIETMNLVEVGQLCMLLQARLSIPDEAVFGGFGGGGGGGGEGGGEAAAEEAAAAEPEQTSFKIKLASFDDGTKFKVLKEIRALQPSLSLTECKALIDNMPSTLVEDADQETVAKWTEALQAVGAQVAVE
jgi:large subunit ribosomal protein L7/L12